MWGGCSMSLTSLFSTLKGGSGNFGHAGRPGHVGGSAPGSGGSSSEVESAKQKITEKATKLGYQSIDFAPPNKKGLIQVIAGGPNGGVPKKQGLFITPDGKIVDKKGKKPLGW